MLKKGSGRICKRWDYSNNSTWPCGLLQMIMVLFVL